MWDNIGEKIKALAKVIAWVGIIGSIISGIVLFKISSIGGGLYVGLGFAAIIGGSLISWISSWFMYGFGELLYNSEIIKYNTSKSENKTNHVSSGLNLSNVPVINPNETKKCKKCHEKVTLDKDACPKCGGWDFFF